MKKASDIILLVSAILSILAVVGYLLAGILCIKFSQTQYKDYYVELIENGKIEIGFLKTTEEKAKFVMRLIYLLGIYLLVLIIPSVVSSFLSFRVRTDSTIGLYVTNIVFGVASSNYVAIVGSIFGLIALNQMKNKEESREA